MQNKSDIPFDATPQFTFQNFADPPFHSYTPTSNDPLQYNNQQSPEQPTAERSKSIFTLGFYQDLFDINTDEVINRIKWSMIPKPNINYLQNCIRNKPDLYGPFWICVTLVFMIAASGNLAEYFQAAASRNYHWKYDFHAISAASTVIFTYAWFIPLILWAILKGYGNEQCKLNLLELICVYGYCLSIFIPLSVLWIIPIRWIQWTFVAIGAATSGTVLITSIYSAFTPKLYPLLAITLILHILLAASFILYFFHVPGTAVVPESPIIYEHVTPAAVVATTTIAAQH